MGYTTRVTCGVWVGFDEPQRIASGGYGSKLALPIWVDFMEQAASFKYEAPDFSPGKNLQSVDLCRISGDLATQGCLSAGTVYRATLPSELIHRETCPNHGPRIVASPFAGQSYYTQSGTPYRPPGVVSAYPPRAAAAQSTTTSSYPQGQQPYQPQGAYVRHRSPLATYASEPAQVRQPTQNPRAVQAVPVDELDTPLEEPYRVIRKQDGFIFQNQ